MIVNYNGVTGFIVVYVVYLEDEYLLI
jgi:hypothetical protein